MGGGEGRLGVGVKGGWVGGGEGWVVEVKTQSGVLGCPRHGDQACEEMESWINRLPGNPPTR